MQDQKTTDKPKYDVQWMFIGSRANSNPNFLNTQKERETMPRKEREKYQKYRAIEDREMPILLDEQHCIKAFSSSFKSYQSLYFHNFLGNNQQTFKRRIADFFKNQYTGSMIVFSGNAFPETGTWHIESNDGEGGVLEETVSYDDVLEAWLGRDKKQRHLLIIIDANYSGHWLRQLSLNGETTITI